MTSCKTQSDTHPTTARSVAMLTNRSGPVVDRDALVEAFAAELTLAAYGVALWTTTQGTWLDLELDLWRALADTVKLRGRDFV